MNTILEYLKNLNENDKVDSEYEKNYSDIDRNIFNQIVLLDPKTNLNGEDITNIGFIAKTLLLPAYKKGETDFIENSDELVNAINLYLEKYIKIKKPNEFESVKDFMEFIDKAEAGEVQATEEKNPLDEIFDKYYSKDMSREEFDHVISLDPTTTNKKIGEVAKNLLLPCYIRDKNEFKQNSDEKIQAAIKTYNEIKSTLNSDQQNLSDYKTISEFVKTMLEGPDSSLTTDLKNNNTIDRHTGRPVKDDIRWVASTRHYDILEPLSHEANKAISGGSSYNNWCTGWDSDSYWNSYRGNNAENGRIFCFMDKEHPRDRVYNWQVRITPSGHIDGNRTFVNGEDYVSGFEGNTYEDQFVSFMLSYPEILLAIKDKEPFNKLEFIQRAAATAKYEKEPFILSEETKYELEINKETLANVVGEIYVRNIEKVPVGICSGFKQLAAVHIEDGVKEIGAHAFKNCLTLKTIELGNTLESIGNEAFAGNEKMKGSVRVPDSLTKVGSKAFFNTHVELKIDKDRTEPIYFSKGDEEWVNAHVKSITIQK